MVSNNDPAYRRPILGTNYLTDLERAEFFENLHAAAPNSVARSAHFYEAHKVTLETLEISHDKFIQIYGYLEQDLLAWQVAGDSRSKKADVIINRLRSFDSNPNILPEYLNALNILKQLNVVTEHDSIRDKSSIKQSDTALFFTADSISEAWNLGNFSNHCKHAKFGLNPEKLGGWMRMGAKNPEYRPYVETILRKSITSCKTTEEIVTLLYNISLGTFDTKDKEVIRYGLELLHGKTSAMDIKDPKFELFHSAFFSYEDSTFNKYNQILTLCRQVGVMKFAAETVAPANAFIKELWQKNHNLYSNKVEGGRTVEQRWKAEGYNMVTMKSTETATASEHHTPEGPLALIANGLSATLLDKHVTLFGKDFFMLLTIPVIAEEVDALKGLINTREDNLLDRAATDRERVTSLFFYCPAIDLSTNQLLIEDLAQLQIDLFNDRTRGVSQRGDAVKIVDPILKELGFKKFTFRHGQAEEELTLNIEIGLHEYRLAIDKDYNLKDLETNEVISLPENYGAWLKHAILSHLYYVQCRPVSENGKDMTTYISRDRKIILGATEAEANSQDPYIERIGHLRKQPPGNTFRDDAAKSAAKERNGMSLKDINERHGCTKASGMITYVRDKYYNDIDPRELPPKELSFSHAMDRLNKAVGLIDDSNLLPSDYFF